MVFSNGEESRKKSSILVRVECFLFWFVRDVGWLGVIEQEQQGLSSLQCFIPMREMCKNILFC